MAVIAENFNHVCVLFAAFVKRWLQRGVQGGGMKLEFLRSGSMMTVQK
jgi:hypothetical protein